MIEDEWKGLILMGAFTGLRLTDCAQLTWESINLEKKEIVTIEKKAGLPIGLRER